MAKYFRHNLSNEISAPDVPIGPLKGGKLALSSRASAVFNGLDKAPAMGRRVLCSFGLNGNLEWHDEGGAGYDLGSRTTATSSANLTPGHFLGASVLYHYGAATPTGVGGNQGSQGRVVIDVTWTDRDAASTTTSHTIELESVDTEDPPVESWASLRVKRHAAIRPGSLVSIVTSRKWSRGTHVAITMSIEGNPYVVDACVYELPHSLSLEADDDADYRVNGAHSVDNPDGTDPSLAYPIQRRSETSPDGDYRSGSWQVSDQVRAQHLRLKPMLWALSGHTEETDVTSVTGDDSYVGYIDSLAAGTWARIPDHVLFPADSGSYNTDPVALLDGAPGLSMASGAYSRPIRENPANSMSKTGSIPVRIKAEVYCQSGTEDFRIRVYTSRYNYVEIDATATTTATEFSAYGHLECGIGPGHQVRAIPMWTRDDASATVILAHLWCEAAGDSEAG